MASGMEVLSNDNTSVSAFWSFALEHTGRMEEIST